MEIPATDTANVMYGLDSGDVVPAGQKVTISVNPFIGHLLRYFVAATETAAAIKVLHVYVVGYCNSEKQRGRWELLREAAEGHVIYTLPAPVAVRAHDEVALVVAAVSDTRITLTAIGDELPAARAERLMMHHCETSPEGSDARQLWDRYIAARADFAVQQNAQRTAVES